MLAAEGFKLPAVGSPSMSMAGWSWDRRLAAVLLGVAIRMLELECSFKTCWIAFLHPYSASLTVLHSGNHELSFSILLAMCLLAVYVLLMQTKLSAGKPMVRGDLPDKKS